MVVAVAAIVVVEIVAVVVVEVRARVVVVGTAVVTVAASAVVAGSWAVVGSEPAACEQAAKIRASPMLRKFTSIYRPPPEEPKEWFLIGREVERFTLLILISLSTSAMASP